MSKVISLPARNRTTQLRFYEQELKAIDRMLEHHQKKESSRPHKESLRKESSGKNWNFWRIKWSL